MIAFKKRRLPSFILASAIFVLGWILRFAHAEELPAQTKAEEASSKEASAAGASAPGQAFDPAVVSAGMAAFARSCTKCHDASRALERTKDLAGWRATVRRMAGKRGADIGSGDIEPIAVYLASRNAAASGTPAEKEKAGAATPSDTSSFSAFATLSPQWRGSKDGLQNPGFAPLAWVGAAWQSKIVSARVTVCVACHGVQEQTFLSRVEVVEAAVRVDLSTLLDPCVRGMNGGIDAGRFVVPFGAFSAQTNPGLYRTVSTPLIFNMGQRLFNQDLGDPVLPMPYVDQGINLNLDVPLGDFVTGPITATMDSYLVNGLAGSSNGIDFLQSRNLLDNNNRVAGGGRLTVGDPYIRAGASYMAGRFDDPNDPGVPSGPLNYRIYGFDVQAHYKKLFRCQVEYARRDSDRFGFLTDGLAKFREKIDGYYVEAEVRPWEDCPVSLVTRYDFQGRHSPMAPVASSLADGTFNVKRLTLGINVELWHQSLLMVNVERWFLPESEFPANVTSRPVNVYGVRYTITF